MTRRKRKRKKKEDEDLSSRQAIAVLGIALIGMGEEIGSEMAFRTFGHLVSRLFGGFHLHTKTESFSVLGLV